MTNLHLLNEYDQKWLLRLARRTLENMPGTGREVPRDQGLPDEEIPPDVEAARGVFVTLRKEGELRGCIGYVMPVEPLYRAVADNAMNAARGDPRFPPVQLEEVPNLTIEISVMTVPEEVDDIDEIEIGRDGLIVSEGMMRGLLLPQVATEYGWDRETFLSHTCRKAGLPMDAWRLGEVRIEKFSAQVFSEDE